MQKNACTWDMIASQMVGCSFAHHDRLEDFSSDTYSAGASEGHAKGSALKRAKKAEKAAQHGSRVTCCVHAALVAPVLLHHLLHGSFAYQLKLCNMRRHGSLFLGAVCNHMRQP